ncbi:fibrobacter succinogenes major paralogous domain-containing protein [Aestuariibaculum lutulentum]|uniref:Fibrobacter succinogenes major paralogous domain-containing protein n=1 Tax=Aestuariibaculum lutulentum TaxID=2920935 RepID=A0ABS9RGY6_9FLAO|nr:fibrobacter succinogenes major paralogous domain-containing protein [Aestuariibaculum lutulentum]MCH4552204.1 fibrobacter succinogenes major paralogous domain-containing protein [Aestuariibaculum lutulentum]
MKLKLFILYSIIVAFSSLGIFSCKQKDSKPSPQKSEIDTTTVKEREIEFFPSTKIGSQIWMIDNLSTEVFSNGDSILEVKTKQEWRDAIKNKIPAWCFASDYKGDSIKIGKIYNFFAVSDERTIAPYGWRVASNKDWSKMVNTINNTPENITNINSDLFWQHLPPVIDNTDFKDLKGGYIYKTGKFYSVNKNSFYWTSDYRITTNAFNKSMWFDYGGILRTPNYEEFGFYIRCLMDY